MRAAFASQCLICLSWGQAPWCQACLARFAAPVRRCMLCAQALTPEHPEAWPCTACQLKPPPLTQCVAALDYAFPWDGLLRDFKFGGALELRVALGERFIAALGAAPSPELLLSVPMSDSHLAERGYNQSHELAKRIARQRGLNYAPQHLRRLKDGPRQASLQRQERLNNMRHAFWLEADAVRGLRVAVVDDVMTTGATVHEIARVLWQAGAAEVHAWVLLRA